MSKWLVPSALLVALLLFGCGSQIDGYTAGSSITKNGFAWNAQQLRERHGQKVMVWGYVDQGNIYGDEGAHVILGEWWSGDGPDADTWRFDVKANPSDEVGHSFEVYVPNDAGRDELLERFASDASAQKQTKVFVTGTMYAYEAPTLGGVRTGVHMQTESSADIKLDQTQEN